MRGCHAKFESLILAMIRKNLFFVFVSRQTFKSFSFTVNDKFYLSDMCNVAVGINLCILFSQVTGTVHMFFCTGLEYWKFHWKRVQGREMNVGRCRNGNLVDYRGCSLGVDDLVNE